MIHYVMTFAVQNQLEGGEEWGSESIKWNEISFNQRKFI